MSTLTFQVDPKSNDTLTEQCFLQFTQQLQHWLPGTRLPSIRDIARSTKLSRFTIVAVYDRLVASSIIEARRGSGFFVVNNMQKQATFTSPDLNINEQDLNINWLLRNVFREVPIVDMPGSGNVPPDWLDSDLVNGALRHVGRHAHRGILGYGNIQGYTPLRQQLANRLKNEHISAEKNHILTTHGVTHALDIIVNHLAQPGDTVFVEDPGWFLIFARLARAGIKVIGIPRTPKGPDIEALDNLAQLHQPKFFLINSAVHNPTGYGLQAGTAYDILRLAEKHQFWIIEDDTYSDLHPTTPIRLATLDQLRRVILVGGFSKTLAANLRVGYIAAAPEIITQLSDIKALSVLTCTEINERIIYQILSDGLYRRHLERLRVRVDSARQACIQALPSLKMTLEHPPQAGFFLWVNCHTDTEELAKQASMHDLILAPGRLFSPQQYPSTMMRLAVSVIETPSIIKKLKELMKNIT